MSRARLEARPASMRDLECGRVQTDEEPAPLDADGGGDFGYAPDVGRAIALLMTTETLDHTIYNVSSGTTFTNRELADAIAQALPGSRPRLIGVLGISDLRIGIEGCGHRVAPDLGSPDRSMWPVQAASRRGPRRVRSPQRGASKLMLC